MGVRVCVLSTSRQLQILILIKCKSRSWPVLSAALCSLVAAGWCVYSLTVLIKCWKGCSPPAGAKLKWEGEIGPVITSFSTSPHTHTHNRKCATVSRKCLLTCYVYSKLAALLWNSWNQRKAEDSPGNPTVFIQSWCSNNISCVWGYNIAPFLIFIHSYQYLE